MARKEFNRKKERRESKWNASAQRKWGEQLNWPKWPLWVASCNCNRCTHTLSQLNFVEKEKLIDFKWGKIKQHAAASSCHCAKCVIKFRLEFSINSATWYNKYAITIIYWQSNRIWFLAKTCEKKALNLWNYDFYGLIAIEYLRWARAFPKIHLICLLLI